jgi:hypothetical protein
MRMLQQYTALIMNIQNLIASPTQSKAPLRIASTPHETYLEEKLLVRSKIDTSDIYDATLPGNLPCRG